MMEHYIIVPSEDHCTYIKIHPENNSFRTITNIDHNQKTSIKKNTYNNIGSPQATISCLHSKVNSVHFEDPYDHINPMYNTNEDTHLIDTQ